MRPIRAGRANRVRDGHQLGACPCGLGLELTDGAPTVRDIFIDSAASVGKIIRQTHIDELNVLPSNIRLERASHLIYTRPKREDVLRRALQPVMDKYDYVIIDCPPSLGSLTKSAIAAADIILIPCQMEPSLVGSQGQRPR